MKKQLLAGMLIAGIMAPLSGGVWVGCSGGEEQCPYCKKSFPISNVRFHVRKCKKNPTKQGMNKPVSGKTTSID
ncbi:MAG: hypothetical protein CMO74_11515 [Verrucomicrobiales bacterium]|nr:hypothetical protein [Verrucomicrobiales bacterium]MBL69059.1 hypothetical protein [Verrucomicrobiales bacterium]